MAQYHVLEPAGGWAKGCGEVAKEDLRKNLIPPLKDSISRWLSIIADRTVPPEPKRDEKALREITETINESIYLKDDLYTLLKACEDEEAAFVF